MYTTSFFQIPNDFGFAQTTLKITLSPNIKGLNIFFKSNDSCSEEESSLINNYKNACEQEIHLERMNYQSTLFHEGCRFGLKYGFQNFLFINNKKKTGVEVWVEKIKYNTGTTHDLVAFVALKAFSEGLSIESDAFYDEKKRRFVFPSATFDIPIGKVTLKELRKIIPINEKELYDKTYKELESVIKDYNNS